MIGKNCDSRVTHYMGRRLLALVMVIAVWGGLTQAAEPIQFADEGFRREVEEALEKQDPNAIDMLAMKDLWVSGKISDISGIEYAKNLEGLSLDTKVHDLAILNKLEKLRKLRLSCYGPATENVLKILPDLSGLKSLKDLELSATQITDFSSLSKLSNLSHLALEFNGIEDIDLLSTLTNLEHLDLREDELEDISGLADVPSLRVLRIINSNVKDISVLKELENLEILTLRSNMISDISALRELQNLKKVSLSGNNICDISALTGLQKLEVLNLYNNPLHKDAHEIYLPNVIKNNPGVAILCDVKTGHVLRDFIIPGLCVLYLTALVVVSHYFWKKKRKRYARLVVFVFLILLVPLPVRDKDIEKVINYSINSLINDQRVVMLNKGYIPFYDSRYINRYMKLLYDNEIDAAKHVYEDLGLEAYGGDDGVGAFGEFYLRNVIIEFSHYDMWKEKSSNSLHFNYYHGILAAQGYRVVVYRNVFGVFPMYIFEWVS